MKLFRVKMRLKDRFIDKLQRNQIDARSVFKTLSNIYDGEFMIIVNG